jgi:hypothetical protein
MADIDQRNRDLQREYLDFLDDEVLELQLPTKVAITQHPL